MAAAGTLCAYRPPGPRVGKLGAGAVDGADGSAVAGDVTTGVTVSGPRMILAHPPVLSLQHVAESLRELDGDESGAAS
jgi:hypothetical protein